MLLNESTRWRYPCLLVFHPGSEQFEPVYQHKPAFHSNCFLQKRFESPLICFCFRILRVSIGSRPLTLTLSNGIACHEGRTRSRSRKCSARVCTGSLIDASLAPMSERIEASAAVSVKRYLAFLKVLGTELKPIFGERNVYPCQDRLIYILLRPGADFKFHLQLPNLVQPGVTLVKTIPDVFLMASFFIFAFLQIFFFSSGSLMF